MGEVWRRDGEHPIAPFLAKCYDMVDDPTTDSIISWSPTDTISSSSSSFIIWDMMRFQQQVLPKYHKHANFSSFMRQLNTYGFRKSDPDRWVFTNDGFIKGQKHLLRNITRRKSTQSLAQQKHSQQNTVSVGTLVQQKHPPQKNISVGQCAEIAKFRPWEEIENLKNDKNVLMQELVNLRQHQQGADNKLLRLRQRLSGMELNQQQMLSLLAMAVQSPGFLAQLLQQNENNWCISEPSRMGPLPALEHGTDGGRPLASERRIVRYQPHKIETPKPPLIMPISNSDGFQQSDHSPNELDDLFRNIDVMSFAEGVSVSMDEDSLSENNAMFVIPELPDDGILDKLPLVSHSDKSEVSRPEAVPNGVEMESVNNDS